MGCKIIIEKGKPPVIQTVLTNGFSGAPINSATVNVIIRDSNGDPVSGESWPAALTYVPDSAGIYRKQTAAGINFVSGNTYTAEFTATDTSLVQPYTWDEEIVVVDSTCNVAPSNSPLSPAYSVPDATALLRDAEAAYHLLMTGRSARVVVDHNGERVEFTATNRASLAAYIQQLRRDLGVAVNAGPAGAFF